MPTAISPSAIRTPSSNRNRLDRVDQRREWRGALEDLELRLDRGWARGIEERRVEQLVEPGVDKGDAEEDAQRKKRATPGRSAVRHSTQLSSGGSSGRIQTW